MLQKRCIGLQSSAEPRNAELQNHAEMENQSQKVGILSKQVSSDRIPVTISQCQLAASGPVSQWRASEKPVKSQWNTFPKWKRKLFQIDEVYFYKVAVKLCSKFQGVWSFKTIIVYKISLIWCIKFPVLQSSMRIISKKVSLWDHLVFPR